uniref:NADH-ubiquinone oxidoreductase chain 2 n=1 Tax=Ophiothrix scotiosa TaxID=3135525 RepID=A0AAU6PX28_9ECHI
MISTLFIFFLIVSVFVTFFCCNWLFIWIWVECITLCLIIIIRSDVINVRNLESISKYFVTQAIASLLILIGVVSRYFSLGIITLAGDYNYFSYGLIFIGLLIKLGVLPNPYWFIDVINGINYSRLIFILVISKIVPLYLLFNLSSVEAFLFFAFVGVLTALISSVLGINQSNFRKLVSFSSVANLGWFTLCLPIMGGLVVIFCFMGYSLTVLPLLWVSNNLKFNSLNKVNRLYHSNNNKLVLLLCLLSLGGLPPFVGFFIKWAFFQSLVDNGLILLSWFLILSSLFSLFFYLYSSFNIYSLFSGNIKGNNIILLGANNKSLSFFIGLSLITVVNLFVFVAVLW